MLSLRHGNVVPRCTALALVIALTVMGWTATPGSADADLGIQIMRGLDRASYLYLDSALRFACQEKIFERSPGWSRSHRFDYLFVYDKVSGFQDYRTDRGKGGKEQTDPAAVGVKRFLARAYMWFLLFNRTRQDKHRYRLLGSEKMHGVRSVKIEFEPIPPFEEGINDWFGTAWVDPAGFQLLRVKAMKSIDHERWQELQKAAEEGFSASAITPGTTYRVNRVTTDFSVVKNGMRFPSQVSIVSTVYYVPDHWNPARILELVEERSVQTYSKYRFYGVRTSEEVRRILEPPP